ncbi:SIMPL domain-containing protein [Gluconacetobacter takamatsuzukensis]|uniref:SIMPL domain-containing protein n=1 Tax=Gluconacetobacter takamatsuzukensis TaxID=1286190 RepID=A0A7W4PNB4_9PROT|nr:SIMPL domain-containing protein [Gluconacetobacter takamatsuzukensis]MBB2203903.1 SIMPL domain-containing protein [Gluconacetobacter takamatsuzukensis]
MTAFHRHALGACALTAAIVLPLAASAQDMPPDQGPGMPEMLPRHAPAGTALTLSGTGTVHAAPDRLTATLFAEASAPGAAAAQERVNSLARTAIDAAKAAGGLTTVTEDYSAEHNEGGKAPAWTARQSIRLTGPDGVALLALVGQLQAKGLGLSGLEWSLSADRRQGLTRQAEAAALTDARQRADAAAKVLGLKIASIRSVTLSDHGGPRPMPMMMMARAASAPMAPAEEQDVSATASATFMLAP